MRIIHIIWSLDIGGAESMLVDILNIQIQTEDVALLIVNDVYDKSLIGKIDSRCRIFFIDRHPGCRDLRPWVKLNWLLYKYNPNIIHFHSEGMLNMIINKAPKLFTIHNTHTSAKEYSKFNVLFAISEGVRRYTQNQGFDSTLVWNGIRTQDIRQKDMSSSLCLNKYCKMVCVGRLYTPHKGQDILIRALGIVKKQTRCGFHLDLIGDGPSHDELIQLIEENGLNDNVNLLGKKS